MATQKKPAAAKKAAEESLEVKLENLRAEMSDQIRSIKSGSATNVHAATKTRREIARTLTAINAKAKQGPKE